jgi:hypothetical protein
VLERIPTAILIHCFEHLQGAYQCNTGSPFGHLQHFLDPPLAVLRMHFPTAYSEIHCPGKPGCFGYLLPCYSKLGAVALVPVSLLTDTMSQLQRAGPNPMIVSAGKKNAAP